MNTSVGTPLYCPLREDAIIGSMVLCYDKTTDEPWLQIQLNYRDLTLFLFENAFKTFIMADVYWPHIHWDVERQVKEFLTEMIY